MAIIDTASVEANTVRMEDALLTDYLILPRLAMQTVGPAAQTLGAVYRMTSKNLFHQVEKVANDASLKPPTCRRHLGVLCQRGWLKRIGRQRRRTVTYTLTKTAKTDKRPYAVLPRWACLEQVDPNRKTTNVSIRVSADDSDAVQLRLATLEIEQPAELATA